MKHDYLSIPFVQYSAKLDEACTWLQKLGIDYSKTRIGRYKEIFSTLSRCQIENTVEKFYESYSLEEWINAVHETAELMRIYEGLFEKNDDNLILRLRDSIKGHELFVLDNSDRSGRDFSFELSMAADFSRNGYEIDFGHEADLKVNFNDHDLYVECKRLKSFNKINRRIKDGLKQLHKRYSNSESPQLARGLLALSIGKLINADLGLLEANDPVHLGEKALYQNNLFIQKYEDAWKRGVDKRTLGTIIVLDTPARLISNKQLTSCHEISIACGWPKNSDNDLLLRDIARRAFGHSAENTVLY